VKLTIIYFSPLGLYLNLFTIFLVGEHLLSIWVVSISWQLQTVLLRIFLDSYLGA